MSKHAEPRDGANLFDALAERSAKAADDATKLLARSEAARSRLRGYKSSDDDGGEAHRDPQAIHAPSEQMARQHVVIVNSDPAFLDAVRIILQAVKYNVTTTNLVPLTYQMVAAVGADVLVIDLAIGEPEIWSLVEQLREGELTRSLPIVVTATKPDLLERAQEERWRAGGRYVFLKPFDPQDLLDAVQSLIGGA